MRSLAVVCALLTVALGLPLAGDRGPSDVDAAAESAIAGWPHGVLQALVQPTEPYVLLPVLALLIAWCLRESRPSDAVFAALAPTIAVAANTWLLKPVFDRWKGDTLVYPSGHTVSMVATLVVLLALTTGRSRTITAAVGAVLLAGVAIGMVGLGYHYLTDVAGGTLFAVSTVLAIRALLTGLRRTGSRSRATSPSHGAFASREDAMSDPPVERGENGPREGR